MGTSNFNVRRNSSVMPVFTDEDVLGSFEQYKADFLDNLDDNDDASNYDTETRYIEERYYDDATFAYESAIYDFFNFLEENVNPKMRPIFENNSNTWDDEFKIRGTVELFSSAYIDVYVNVKTETGYYEGVTFDWDVVIETSSGAWYDCLEYFKEDFCYDDLVDMTGEEGDAVDFAVPIIIKMVEDKVDEMTSEIDRVFSLSNSTKLRRVGGFSDGTSVYEKA